MALTRRRGTLLLVALGLPCAALLGAPAEARACPGAKARAANASPAKLRAAVLCVVNRRRAAAGLPKLRRDRRLQKAAGRHARDMVHRDYFAHQRPGGPDLSERLDRAGWRGTRWGETIAYGCGRASSPKATLRAWLKSPPHRAILLSRAYRRGGVGIGGEAPCGRRGATWVLDVGRR